MKNQQPTAKKKRVISAVCSPTMDDKSCEYWKLKKNEKIIVTKIYFYNGESHIKGYYEKNPTEKIDRPAVFFDVKNWPNE